jgi:hypothetical protein
MKFNYARFVFLASILLATFMVAPVCFASSITGDTFTVTVSEDFVLPTESGSGVAGSPGIDVSVQPSFSVFDVDWLDEDTFNLDFFSGEGSDLENLTIALTGLDFVENGMPVDIIGVTPLPLREFDWPKDVFFTANSITIVYPFLDPFEAGDGSQPSFDVMTTAAPAVPEPATLSLIASGFGLLGFIAALGKRKRNLKT